MPPVRSLRLPALAAAVGGLVAATMAGLAAGGARSAPPSVARVAAVLDSSERAVLWGAVVADARTGEVLLERNADRLLLPASVQKVVTAATALDRLGARYRYRTPLLFSGVLDTSGARRTLRGTFVVVGQGDPSFGSAELPLSDPLEAWAEGLRARGIARVEGMLVGDDDRFDDTLFPEGWDVQYVYRYADRYLGAPVGALSYRDNLVTLRLGPGATDVAATPEGVLEVRRRDRATDRTRGLGAGVRRLPGTGRVEITGTVRRRAEDLDLPVDDPTRLTLVAFRNALGRAGLDTTGLRLVDVDERPERPDWRGFDTLAVHASPPLADLVAVMGTRSDNFYAEQIFRTLSPGGDAAGSQDAVRGFLRQSGDTTGVAVFDGSGLSRKNLLTARALSRTLVRMAAHRDVDAFFGALPYPGQRGGTLEHRLDGVPLRAKTGSLEHVRSLVGYVRTASGRDLAFVFVANHYAASDARVTRLLDRMATLLAEG